ncbi:MAG: NAD-dependent dihydropyrimidine dehydrogenase subunit PreA, partial [Acidobacteriia bacterium]|nr:NAD-dependent dihydropyrimidine dehydrogenase subunit PreA [Terriglobia bacterium]
VGCRLCHNVCPVENCIAMVEVPSGREQVTWGALVKSRPEVTEDWDAMLEYRKKMGIHIH